MTKTIIHKVDLYVKTTDLNFSQPKGRQKAHNFNTWRSALISSGVHLLISNTTTQTYTQHVSLKHIGQRSLEEVRLGSAKKV